MKVTEPYKNRLQELAGLAIAKGKQILEVMTSSEKEALYKNSNERVPFDRALMKKAIENGMEIGLSFQSNNEKYKMPVSKFRVVQPVAMGISSTGELVIRGLHVVGQSEKAALATGVRSKEVENQWRLFKAKNIKSMWLTGRYFHGPMPGYNPNDKHMTSVEVSISFTKAKNYQDNLVKQAQAKEKEAKPVRPLFKDNPALPPKMKKFNPQKGKNLDPGTEDPNNGNSN